MPGIGIRLPTISFSGSQVNRRVMSFALSLFLGAGLYMVWTSPALIAAPPDITGNSRIASEELTAVMGTSGFRIFELIPSELENRLQQNYPELLSARVTISLPNPRSRSESWSGPRKYCGGRRTVTRGSMHMEWHFVHVEPG